SFVLTASAKFNETLDNVVKGLQEAGFSKDDYYAEQLPEQALTPDEMMQQDLFDSGSEDEPKSDDDFNLEEIKFNTEDEVSNKSNHETVSVVDYITKKAEIDVAAYEAKVNEIDID